MSSPQAVPRWPDPSHSLPTATTPSPAQPQNDDEKRAWSYQYHGYPALSEWMASSHDFFILRRFAKSCGRCLLRRQHVIAKLEDELEKIDKFMQQQPAGYGSCDSFDEDEDPRRLELIKELEDQLQRYYNLVNSFTEIRKRPGAQRHHRANLRNWFEAYPEAIQLPEQHFRDQRHEGDIFPIVMKEKSPLRLFLGRISWLRLLFNSRGKAGQVDSPLTRYTSEAGLDQFTNFTILIVGLGLLFAPMWILNFLVDDEKRLGVITGFVTAFTLLAWSAAGQRPFEVMAATAAYAAVLMVYQQQDS